ncbi:hypothetical protein Tco_0988138 [Tanacetum coccineum]|uniref:Ribosomal protein S10 n=1 Tax=Tanacetum coccineum TaxID=301880 RepID=A0ABQ5EQH2_9ASTR
MRTIDLSPVRQTLRRTISGRQFVIEPLRIEYPITGRSNRRAKANEFRAEALGESILSKQTFFGHEPRRPHAHNPVTSTRSPSTMRFIELLLRGSGNILTKLPRECLKSSRAIQVRQTLARGSVVPRVSNKLFHPSCFIELLELKGIPQEVLGFYRYNPSEIPLQAILNSEPTLPPSSKELSPPKSELSLKALETNTATSPLMNQLRINEEVRGEGGKWGGGRRMGAEEEGKRGREEGKGEKRKREVDTSKRTENQANDKTEHGRKRQCKNQGQKSQNAKVKSIPEESAVKPEP